MTNDELFRSKSGDDIECSDKNVRNVTTNDNVYIHYEEGFNGTNYYHEIQYTIDKHEITIKRAKQLLEQGDIEVKKISDENYKKLTEVLNKYYYILNQKPRDNLIVIDGGNDSWYYHIANKTAEDVSMLFSCDDNALFSVAYKEYTEVLKSIFNS